MTALSKIQSAGFIVTMVNGSLAVKPTKAKLTDSQKDYIKTHKEEIKDEIIKQILGAQLHDALETKSMRVYSYRVKSKPSSELTVIMPNTELDEAIVKLNEKFGDRLLSVMPVINIAASPTKY